MVLDSGYPVGADLVVDATGRGTRLPVWLAQWGFERPREDRVDVGIAYATHQLRIPDGLIAEKVVVAGASRKQLLGLGMLYYEDGTWGLTTFGVGKVEPPHDFAGMCALADEILPGHVAAAIRQGEPIGEVAFHKFPTSRWRRYDKLDRFPAGIIPFGDAVVSFNPTFGQGMTMTSLQTGHLRRVLETPGADLARDFNRAAAKTTYPVWTMNAIGDLVLHRATGPMPWWYRPVGNLFDQFLGAAETDPVLAEWFLRRFSLLDSLYMVPSARLVGRTIRHNMRLWLAEKGRAGQCPVAIWWQAHSPGSFGGGGPMSSLIRPLEDVASCGIPYWLPPGGRDNGVWADMWVLIAELESDDASEVLGLLADADVGGYAAIPGGTRARARGPVRHRLWVDAMQYGLAEDVLIRFMRGRSAHDPGPVPGR